MRQSQNKIYKASQLTVSIQPQRSPKAPIVLPIKWGPQKRYLRAIDQDEFLKEIFTLKINNPLANLSVRSRVTSEEPNRPLMNSRPPIVDPRPIVIANVVNLFPSSNKPTAVKHWLCTTTAILSHTYVWNTATSQNSCHWYYQFFSSVNHLSRI